MSKDPAANEAALRQLHRQIVECTKCARLVGYCAAVAREKRRAFRDWQYWGKPVPPFGDPHARLLILGLAPAAHGANRTGRMFTGDNSGEFLYAALHRAGLASQPHSTDRNDGLELRDAYITATVRCAPPGNKPAPQEKANCRPFLERELQLLASVQAVLVLGRIAFDAYLGLLKDQGQIAKRSTYRFEHGGEYRLPAGLPRLFASYHPSQQNTFTGKLTAPMLDSVMHRIRRFLRR